MLTGNNGLGWAKAVEDVAAKTGVPIAIEIIGPGQATEDPFGEFAAVRETGESGALLVRPDLYIAARHMGSPASPEQAHEWLSCALRSVLRAG